MTERLMEKDITMLHCLIALALENAGSCCCSRRRTRMASGRSPIDAFPDTTPVQVQINTTAPALGPEEIEQQVTLPVELAVSGLPGLAEVRSVSKFGFSQVVATFTDDTSVYGARQFITERLNTVELPEGIERPQLGPIATGLGEVFHYMLHSDNPERSLEELRTLHDWVVKPGLLKTPGVAEVNSWGGHEKQYHVIVRPEASSSTGSFCTTRTTPSSAITPTSGRPDHARLTNPCSSRASSRRRHRGDREHRRKAHGGAPIRVRDVAEVRAYHEIRRGAVTLPGAEAKPSSASGSC